MLDKNIALAISAFLVFPVLTVAQTLPPSCIEALSAKPKPSPQLQITQVQPDSSNDFIQLFIPPTAIPLNLMDWQLVTDNVYTTFPDYEITESSFIQIYQFDTDTADLITGKGLTKTSENLNLVNPAGEIVDALCWHNQSPTTDELTDYAHLLEIQQWSSDCLDSTELTKDVIFQRTSQFDTNTAADWQLVLPETNNLETSINAKIEILNSPDFSQPPSLIEISGSQSKIADNTTITWTLNDTFYSNSLTPPAIEMTEPGLHEIQLTLATANQLSTATHSFIILEANEPQPQEPQPVQPPTGETNQEPENWQYFKIQSALPNPAGPDTNNELITLIYAGSKPLTITDWQLDDAEGGSKPYTIPQTTLQPNQELLIYNSESRINLNNGGDTVRLFNPHGDLHDQLIYTNSQEDQAISANKPELSLPSESTNNSTETTANNETAAVISTKTAAATKSANNNLTTINTSKSLEITEIFPNPPGQDANGEWFELYNPTSSPINLSNWIISIKDKPINFNEQPIINPQQYLQIKQDIAKFSLSNSEGSLSINSRNSPEQQTITYTNAKEAQSYSYMNNQWQWTKYLTPGSTNPQTKSITGTFSINPEKLKQNTLQLNNSQQTITIQFQNGEIPLEQIAAINKNPNQTLDLKLAYLKTPQGNFLTKLERFNLIKTSNPWPIILLISILVVGLATIALIKRKWLIEKLKSVINTSQKPDLELNF